MKEFAIGIFSESFYKILSDISFPKNSTEEGWTDIRYTITITLQRSISNQKGEVVEFRSGGTRILWDHEEKGLLMALGGGMEPKEQIEFP